MVEVHVELEVLNLPRPVRQVGRTLPKTVAKRGVQRVRVDIGPVRGRFSVVAADDEPPAGVGTMARIPATTNTHPAAYLALNPVTETDT